MATAEVQNIGPGGVMGDDEIKAEYEDIKSSISALEKICEFWDATLNHDAFTEFTDKMQGEADQKCIAWRSPEFKPRDFATEQPRVLAIDQVMEEITEFAADKREQLSAQRRMKATFEDRYPLLLGVDPKPENDEKSEEGDLLIIVLPPLESMTKKQAAEDQKLIKRMMESGFTSRGANIDYERIYSAEATPEAEGLFESIQDHDLVVEARRGSI